VEYSYDYRFPCTYIFQLLSSILSGKSFFAKKNSPFSLSVEKKPFRGRQQNKAIILKRAFPQLGKGYATVSKKTPFVTFLYA
jgi:hypothetical protein